MTEYCVGLSQFSNSVMCHIMLCRTCYLVFRCHWTADSPHWTKLWNSNHKKNQQTYYEQIYD